MVRLGRPTVNATLLIFEDSRIRDIIDRIQSVSDSRKGCSVNTGSKTGMHLQVEIAIGSITTGITQGATIRPPDGEVIRLRLGR